MSAKGRKLVKLAALGLAIGTALGLLIPTWAAERVLYVVLMLGVIAATTGFCVEAVSPGWWHENFGEGSEHR